MIKANFLISVNRKAWVTGSKKLYIAEPYVYYDMQKKDETVNYDEIIIAPHLWKSKEELLEAHLFVDKKYKEYLKIFTVRLNIIHGRNYEVEFWQKCFSLAIIRYINFIYQTFQLAESYYDSELHICKILSERSYFTPSNFNEHRDFFQYTAYGQEQLFSIYQNLFSDQKLSEFDDHFDWNIKYGTTKISKLVNIIKTTLPKIYRKLLKISFSDFISGLFHIQPKTNIKVGILGSFFSPSFFNTLIIKSKGAILPIRTNMSFRSTPGPNLGMRSVLSSIDSGFDKFDRFFFTSLTACFPKEFLEDFSQIESYYLEYFKKYESLKYIVSERWIGDTNTSTALAILKTNGVKHIYNEHNFLSQQFAGNSNKYLMSMVDHFVTLGWYEKGIDNLVRGASLFEFSLKKRQNKIHDILFIQGLACVKLPEFNVSYGEFGSANADRFLQFNDSFFKSLSKATLNKITYRPYPVNSWLVSSVLNPMISYDYQYTFLQKYLVDCKEINTASGNSKVLISQSKLVVINYLSTAYLEALLSDVPTIFFWNKESYYLDDKYSGFYDLLTSVGICQTDPVKAAMFIEGIAERPDEWWFSDPVRNARNSFLTTNFGEPQKMVDYLIELAKV